jgi:ubiquitin-conjugating enzyme E2 variant
MLLLNILLSWLFADFLTGIVHWFEDRYIDPDKFDVFGVGADNKLHHEKPTAMIDSHWFENIRYSAVVAWPLALLLYLLGFHVVIWLGVAFSAFGNLIHRFSHLPERKKNRIIKLMQKTGLFITSEHHDKHHRSMKRLIPKQEAGYKFCAMTNWLNPVLDTVHFWALLERFFSVFGLKTIKETNNA